MCRLFGQAGAKAVYLHGCVGPCGVKVWGPDDASDKCDLCGTSRYDEEGKPKEFVIHFPLEERFKSLLSCPHFVDALRHEHTRTTNKDYMTGSCIPTLTTMYISVVPFSLLLSHLYITLYDYGSCLFVEHLACGLN